MTGRLWDETCLERLSSGIFSIDVGLDPSINQYQSGVLAAQHLDVECKSDRLCYQTTQAQPKPYHIPVQTCKRRSSPRANLVTGHVVYPLVN